MALDLNSAKPLPLFAKHGDTIWCVASIQAAMLLLSMLILDGGGFKFFVAVSSLGYWMSVGVIVLRRRQRPRPSDVFFFEYGWGVMAIAALLCAGVMEWARSH